MIFLNINLHKILYIVCVSKVFEVKTIKETLKKIVSIPAKPVSPYPQVISWLFMVFMLFSFIYVCEVTGM